jgi:hypothetical protein
MCHFSLSKLEACLQNEPAPLPREVGLRHAVAVLSSVARHIAQAGEYPTAPLLCDSQALKAGSEPRRNRANLPSAAASVGPIFHAYQPGLSGRGGPRHALLIEGGPYL